MRSILHLLAYALVIGAAIYSVASVHGQQVHDCKSEQQLRRDMVFVLQGAGASERIQLQILNRSASAEERAQLAQSFGPGYAEAFKRIKGHLTC